MEKEVKFINLYDNEVEYVFIKSKTNSNKNFIFVHGFTGNFDRLFELADHLTDYNLYGLNFPLSGNTKYSSKEQVSVFWYAKLLSEFMKQLNLKNTTLFGHSMGGATVILAYPEVKDFINKLILVAPVNRTSLVRESMFKNWFIKPTLEAREHVINNIYHDGKIFWNKAQTQEKAQAFIKIMKSNMDFNNKVSNLGLELISEKLFTTLESIFPIIKVQTVLIYGTSDKIIDAENIQAYYETLIPSIYVIKLFNSGHIPWEETPKEFFNQLAKIL